MKQYLLHGVKTVSLSTVLIGLLILAGCSGRVPVSGTVKYADGSPLATGIVYFESGERQGFGMIGSDGRYRAGEIKPADGLKPGHYRVRLISRTGGTSDGAPLVRFVDPSFENVETSGLSCEVKGKTEYDIVVNKPAKQ